MERVVRSNEIECSRRIFDQISAPDASSFATKPSKLSIVVSSATPSSESGPAKTPVT